MPEVVGSLKKLQKYYKLFLFENNKYSTHWYYVNMPVGAVLCIENGLLKRLTAAPAGQIWQLRGDGTSRFEIETIVCFENRTAF